MRAEADLKLDAGYGALTFDPAVGNLSSLLFRTGGREITPLHAAPWVGSPMAEADADMLPLQKKLSGDFFCAPFAANDIENGPAHGWSANSQWIIERQSGVDMIARLGRTVMGATLRKKLRLSEEAPILYQTHWIEGGEGALNCAHHPMVKARGKARFFTSPKRKALTPAEPLDPGRNRLACPAESDTLSAFPASDGQSIDLSRLPIGSQHEDFVTLVEADLSDVGWSAVHREEEGDIILFLKDSAILPVTMLWHSNGGRDAWPWNGTHTGVLGVEDGRSAGADGHRASLGDNPVSRCGVPTCFALERDKTHRIAHVCGAITTPAGWTEIADIRLADGELHIVERGGEHVTLPFETDFFQRDDTHGYR